jgi:hypothetical protein
MSIRLAGMLASRHGRPLRIMGALEGTARWAAARRPDLAWFIAPQCVRIVDMRHIARRLTISEMFKVHADMCIWPSHPYHRYFAARCGDQRKAHFAAGMIRGLRCWYSAR